MANDQFITVAELASATEHALSLAGVSADDASLIAKVLVTTDAWGVHTHGTKLLRDYVKRLKGGGIAATGRPRVDREGLAWANVDGDSAMGHVAGHFAMELACEKAKKCGIAYVSVRNTNHFGAAGYYAWLAADKGLIGISVANDIPSVAAPGSRKAVTGSNPLSYGIPIGVGEDPILLDMATSTVAGGKVYAATQRGEQIPDNWIIGPDGLPTTDGSLYPSQAALAPMAGHKGYGIALLIEALSGIVSGAAYTWKVGSWIWDDPAKPTNHGSAFIAIDVGQMMPKAEFEQRMKALREEIHATPTAVGIERVMLPGEREWKNYRIAQQRGINLPPDVLQKWELLSSDLGYTFLPNVC